MEMIFTTDVGTRFKEGDLRDYPRSVWNDIASAAGKSLSKIAVPIADLAKKTPKKQRKGKK